MVGGGVLAMTSTRWCKWCGKEMPTPDPRRVTCGHPICTRKQSGHLDTAERRIISAWEKTDPAMQEWDRLLAVKDTTGDSIAYCIRILRAREFIK